MELPEIRKGRRIMPADRAISIEQLFEPPFGDPPSRQNGRRAIHAEAWWAPAPVLKVPVACSEVSSKTTVLLLPSSFAR